MREGNKLINSKKFYVMEPKENIIQNKEDMKSFVEIYEAMYFLSNEPDEDNGLNYLGVSQSQRWIEEDMENLLGIGGIKKASWEQSDVIHILAWKMGRINHKDSVKPEYKYIGNDEDFNPDKISWSDGTQKYCNNLKAKNRSGNIEHITEFVDNIIKFRGKYLSNEFENNNDMLKDLRDTLIIDEQNKVNGIGAVYLVTLLYFISGGKYPIYDQFAAKALKAILKGIKPGSKIQINNFPDKNSKSFLKMLDDNLSSVYKEYINELEEVSEMFYDGDRQGYKKDRRLDRALWVYGHLFG